MSIAAGATALGRAFAESLMTDSLRVTRASGTPVLDEETLEYSTPTVTLYEGPGRIKLSSPVTRDVDAQAQNLTLQEPRVDLPIVGSEAVRTGDLVEVIASLTDAGNAGLQLRIAGAFAQTFATARRFPAEVITGD